MILGAISYERVLTVNVDAGEEPGTGGVAAMAAMEVGSSGSMLEVVLLLSGGQQVEEGRSGSPVLPVVQHGYPATTARDLVALRAAFGSLKFLLALIRAANHEKLWFPGGRFGGGVRSWGGSLGGELPERSPLPFGAGAPKGAC